MEKNEKENFMYCFKHHAFSLLHKVGIKGKDIKNKLFLYDGPIICDMQNVNIYIMCDKTLVLLLCTHTAAQWAM